MVSGTAEVIVEGEKASLGQGLAVVPAGARHEVRNAGDEPLRFVAVYAASDVTTTYEEGVQPDGERERSSTG